MRAVLDPLPSALDGVVVQIHETLAPQLVVENRTARTLEILDDRGRAFIRIGPDGVEGDHGASAWFLTLSKAQVPIPASAQEPDAPARWRTVSHDPTWGWFDPRVHSGVVDDHHAAAPAAALAAAPAAAPRAPRTHFEIPVRMDGQPARLSGRFIAKQVLPGRYEARLAAESRLPDGVSLTVVQGNPPALMLRNTGAQAVTVLGLDDEPYLRIGPDGVDANVVSNTWRQYGRGRVDAGVVSGAAAGEPQWQRVSSQPLYTWLEPRAEVDLARAPPAGTRRVTASRWHLALRHGDRRYPVQGRTDWIPDAAVAHAH